MARLIVLSPERWATFMDIIGQIDGGAVIVHEGVIPEDKLDKAERFADTYDFGGGDPDVIIDIVGIEDTAHHFLDVAGIFDEEDADA